MKVKELIKELQKMPQHADVKHVWDGEARTEIELIWLARDGFVATSDYDQIVYSNGSRPENAPTERQRMYWRTRHR